MTTVPISSTDQSSSFLAKLWSPRNRYYFIAFLFILPALINFSIFRYLPIFAAARASLWQYSLLGGYRDFIGLQHYQFMMEDVYFWKSMKVTALFVLMKVPLQVLLSLMFAVLLQKETRSSAVVRSAIFTPVVTSVVVVSIIWAMMYHSQLGLINSILSAFGIPRQVFLSDADRALPAMTAMMIWKDLGFSMIIIMAGLKGIPVVYREAAIVDGAKPWQIMRYITFAFVAAGLDVRSSYTKHLFVSEFCPCLCHDEGWPHGFNQGDSVLHISIRFSVPGYGLCECYVGSDFAGFVGS